MRKLAREAVIFMLVGMLLATIGTYADLRYERLKYIQAQRDVLLRECVIVHSSPQGYTLIWDLNGKPTSLAECEFVFGDGKDTVPPEAVNADDDTLGP